MEKKGDERLHVNFYEFVPILHVGPRNLNLGGQCHER